MIRSLRRFLVSVEPAAIVAPPGAAAVSTRYRTDHIRMPTDPVGYELSAAVRHAMAGAFGFSWEASE